MYYLFLLVFLSLNMAFQSFLPNLQSLLCGLINIFLAFDFLPNGCVYLHLAPHLQLFIDIDHLFLANRSSISESDKHIKESTTGSLPFSQ